jgi:RNA polymerase sigma-70 factor (ECF subfamily)
MESVTLRHGAALTMAGGREEKRMPQSAGQDSGQQARQVHVEQLYASYRPYLLDMAYRMLGSVSDAEDAVQDLFAALDKERLPNVSNPKAYLAKGLTHRCLNVMKSAARRKVTYVGEWLPEPWTETPDNAMAEIERREDISYAFLVMLERLTPLERAVVVLREAFDCDYAEIAGMLDKTETACRKILSRAKKKLGNRVQPAPYHPQGEQELVQRWVSAIASGRIGDILDLIAEDAVLVTDGGGKTRAAINPIYGRVRVAALLQTMAARRFKDARLYGARINGSIGIVAVEDGRLTGVTCFDWNEDGTVQNVYAVLNPEKLERIAVPAPAYIG